MYGQIGGGSNHQRVRLVRMQPHNSRAGVHRRRRMVEKCCLLLAILFFFAAGSSAAYYCVHAAGVNAAAQESVAEAAVKARELPKALKLSKILKLSMTLNLSGEFLAGSAIADASGIVVLEEEQEPHIPLIAIDAGHGGDDEGCSRDEILEKEINLALACRLSEKLKELDFETILIREDNETTLTLEERVAKAEEAGADIYVSIHQNACEEEESSITGIETWYCGMSEGSRRLAQLIHKGAVEKTGANDRELRETEELYVIREASMPSCLIETGFLSNKKERENLSAEEYQEKLAAGMAWGINLYFNPRTMYLTFDDGPSEENTTKVLDILKEHNIKATFFVVGENVRKHPEVARRIVEEGHTVGIHCNRHVYNEIYESVDSYLEDFQAAYDAVYEATGVEVELFRFPGGSVNAYNKNVYEEIIAEMTERGFIYFDWNASLEDAVRTSTPEGLIKNAVDSTLGRKKVVMLAHDIVYNTTQCLEKLIDSLPEYKMEPLTSEVAPIQF